MNEEGIKCSNCKAWDINILDKYCGGCGKKLELTIFAIYYEKDKHQFYLRLSNEITDVIVIKKIKIRLIQQIENIIVKQTKNILINYKETKEIFLKLYKNTKIEYNKKYCLEIEYIKKSGNQNKKDNLKYIFFNLKLENDKIIILETEKFFKIKINKEDSKIDIKKINIRNKNPQKIFFDLLNFDNNKLFFEYKIKNNEIDKILKEKLELELRDFHNDKCFINLYIYILNKDYILLTLNQNLSNFRRVNKTFYTFELKSKIRDLEIEIKDIKFHPEQIEIKYKKINKIYKFDIEIKDTLKIKDNISLDIYLWECENSIRYNIDIPGEELFINFDNNISYGIYKKKIIKKLDYIYFKDDKNKNYPNYEIGGGDPSPPKEYKYFINYANHSLLREEKVYYIKLNGEVIKFKIEHILHLILKKIIEEIEEKYNIFIKKIIIKVPKFNKKIEEIFKNALNENALNNCLLSNQFKFKSINKKIEIKEGVLNNDKK